MSDTTFRISDRIEAMPPYIFSEINRIKAEAQKNGMQLLSLAIGDPDRPTPAPIVAKLQEAAAKPENHFYSPYEGTLAFRASVAKWFDSRFGVKLDPETEVVTLIGSKEGLAHFPLAFCNPGDRALYPSPGYPIFQTCLLLAGAIPVPLPQRAEKGFLPDLAELERLLKEQRPKLMILNYPSNPTTSVAPREVLTEIVRLARKYRTILAYDNAYAEMYFDPKNKPASILEIPGAKEVAIEFHSLSKTFNMTGWRLAFAVGNPDLLKGLLRTKTNIDSGPLLTVQEAGSFALENYQALSEPIRKMYAERRDALLKGLDRLSIEYFKPEATFFVWARVPNGQASMDFAKNLIEKEGLVVTPGIGFGKEGEGYFRLALTVETSQIEAALARLERYLRT